MKKNVSKKLSLRPETVRALESRELARAAGGMKNVSDGWVCETLSHGLSCWGACSTQLWC
ncbi:MAG TPA: class I lanthipeptide [Kofleriaceae bacterium]|nr:class I lanthipeptide [Kofleriaceae bacterium]